MESYDVVIVGAGPAGLRCAEVLAKNNKRVLVLEKNKVVGDKVCAGGLTLKDLELGIPKKIIDRVFKRIKVHTAYQDTVLKAEVPVIATVERKSLGEWMENNAKKEGAKIKLGSNVTKITNKTITFNDKFKVKYKYLVGADGSSSVVRKYLRLGTDMFLELLEYRTSEKFKDLEFFLDIKDLEQTYLWIFPHKNSASVGISWDLTRSFRPNLKVGDIKKRFDNWCKNRFNIKKAKLRAAIINYDYKGHEFGNVFLAGDAGGFASGLDGEGIYSAIKSGEDVARKIIDINYGYPNINHILKVKNLEETFLRSLEINSKWTHIEFEFINLLLKFKWFDKAIINALNS